MGLLVLVLANGSARRETGTTSMLPLDQVIGGKSVNEIPREKRPLAHPLPDTWPTPLVSNPIPMHLEIFAAINGLTNLSQN